MIGLLTLGGSHAAFTQDCDFNGNPDACELAFITCVPFFGCFCSVLGCSPCGGSSDCNTNGVPDECDLGIQHNCCEDHGPGCNDPTIEACVCAADSYCCNTFWDNVCVDEVVTFGCGTCTATGSDCNSNAVPDDCDIAGATTEDCNTNGIPDECDIADGTSDDCNTNGIPDECDPAPCAAEDVNCDGNVNALDLAVVQAPLNWSASAVTASDPRSDVNRDGNVNALDLAVIQAPLNWATATGPCTCCYP